MWYNRAVSAVSHICVQHNLLALNVLSPHQQNIASGTALYVLHKGLGWGCRSVGEQLVFASAAAYVSV